MPARHDGSVADPPGMLRQPLIRHARIGVAADDAVTSRMTPISKSESKGQP
jgi:hypothetical protein